MPWRRRYFILIAGLPLVVGTLTPLGTAPWYPYVILATLVFVTEVIVYSFAAKRAKALKAFSALLGIGFVAFVWVAQQSKTGSAVLLILAVALGIGLGAWVLRRLLLGA